MSDLTNAERNDLRIALSNSGYLSYSLDAADALDKLLPIIKRIVASRIEAVAEHFDYLADEARKRGGHPETDRPHFWAERIERHTRAANEVRSIAPRLHCFGDEHSRHCARWMAAAPGQRGCVCDVAKDVPDDY